MEPTDWELMSAVRNGDLEKFGSLFDRHQQSLFNYFYRLSGDAASSEDLVQDVFLRMLKYRRSFRHDSQFRAWMYQIARTARIDRFKRHREEQSSTQVPTLRSPQDGPDRCLEDAEQNVLLQKALLRLPEDKRELLVLARFQQMKYSEIGALLGIEASIVKVRVHRAIVELRDIALSLAGERTHAM
jgi:RNA polymerase sigma factor (sigma-70 family)